MFFSLFPFVIFLLALLRLLNIPGFFDTLLGQARTVLPGDTYRLLEDVVGQVREQAAGRVLSFGGSTMVTLAAGGPVLVARRPA